jgi:hypothetical protein
MRSSEHSVKQRNVSKGLHLARMKLQFLTLEIMDKRALR